MSTKFLMPRLDNYYSDYLQLGFYYKEGDKMVAHYTYTEDAYGKVYSQQVSINLAYFPKKFKFSFQWNGFVQKFIKVWLHEYLHLIGLNEEGLRKVKKLGFPCA